METWERLVMFIGLFVYAVALFLAFTGFLNLLVS